MNYGTFGSISSGTMCTEDLLDSFARELERLVQRNAEAWCSDAGRAQRDAYMDLIGRAREVSFDDEIGEANAEDILQELFGSLDCFAPAYAYFGSHPGDGADYGFWLSEDWQEQARDSGALEVSDTADVPDTYIGDVLHINDHGNVTLYAADKGSLSEIWSCV